MKILKIGTKKSHLLKIIASIFHEGADGSVVCILKSLNLVFYPPQSLPPPPSPDVDIETV